MNEAEEIKELKELINDCYNLYQCMMIMEYAIVGYNHEHEGVYWLYDMHMYTKKKFNRLYNKLDRYSGKIMAKNYNI